MFWCYYFWIFELFFQQNQSSNIYFGKKIWSVFFKILELHILTISNSWGHTPPSRFFYIFFSESLRIRASFYSHLIFYTCFPDLVEIWPGGSEIWLSVVFSRPTLENFIRLLFLKHWDFDSECYYPFFINSASVLFIF